MRSPPSASLADTRRLDRRGIISPQDARARAGNAAGLPRARTESRDSSTCPSSSIATTDTRTSRMAAARWRRTPARDLAGLPPGKGQAVPRCRAARAPAPRAGRPVPGRGTSLAQNCRCRCSSGSRGTATGRPCRRYHDVRRGRWSAGTYRSWERVPPASENPALACGQAAFSEDGHVRSRHVDVAPSKTDGIQATLPHNPAASPSSHYPHAADDK